MCVNPKIIYYNRMLKNDKCSGSLIFERTNENVNYCKDLVKTFGGVSAFIQCGKCIECLNKRALEWSIRCSCEFITNSNCCYFLTLTYNDLKNDNNLHKNHVKDFLKKLYNRGFHFKYFLCGEYGSTTLRPHYHIILWLDDKIKDLVSYDNKTLYTSKFIQDLWSYGDVKIGLADYGSIFYTAGYCLKKLGKDSIKGFNKEFQLFSKGIGFDYFNQNYESIVINDEIYINGSVYGLPRYFSKLIKERNPKIYNDMYKKRFNDSFENFNISGKSEKVLHLSNKQKGLLLKEFEKFRKLRGF